MKYILCFFALIAFILVFSACEKADKLPFYGEGKAITLTASATTIAPQPKDSNNVVLTFSWTSPEYPLESSDTKFIVELDAAGNQFKDAVRKTIIGKLDTSFLAKELNSFALSHKGEFNKPFQMEARVISSYENNNDQKISSAVPFTFTPYKVPPKIALPATEHLFLVGNASQGGWTNPAPVPSQEFSRIDETTFAGVFNLIGGSEFLVLPQNDGNWDNKYAVHDNGVPGIKEGGDFGTGKEFDQNFKGPEADGWYKITLDFQAGEFTVTPWGGHIPDGLFITGSAAPSDWVNPVPVPSQEFTQLNSSEFELTITLHGGKEYLLLPVNNGDWSHKYAVEDASVPGLSMGGALGYDFDKNIPGPSEDGTYKINVNFAKGVQGMFMLTKQ